jgi:hypothetical protein
MVWIFFVLCSTPLMKKPLHLFSFAIISESINLCFNRQDQLDKDRYIAWPLRASPEGQTDGNDWSGSNQSHVRLTVWGPVIFISSDPVRITSLTSDLQQKPMRSKLSHPAYRHLKPITSAPWYMPWCHGGTNGQMSTVTMWRSDV